MSDTTDESGTLVSLGQRWREKPPGERTFTVFGRLANLNGWAVHWTGAPDETLDLIRDEQFDSDFQLVPGGWEPLGSGDPRPRAMSEQLEDD